MYLKLVSTKNANVKSTIKKAILNPSINNNGLWSFLKINKMSKNYFNELPNKDFNEIALDISKNFGLDNEIKEEKLKQIIDKSFNFPIINRKISTNLSMCELYHGPSKSFKDIGTIFTANLIEEFNDNKKLHIITATTGDTGSAVASAFYKKNNIKVHILYPKDKISKIQRKQMTTLGNNIKCYVVDGNFDDCQIIVKKLLKNVENSTTCNSINIGRIIAQTFYYFYTCKDHLDKKINFSIPTGNLGNGLSCYIAKQMGLPINDIIYACNNNSNLNYYLDNKDKKTTSVKTLANAIDIIEPSNYERLLYFINNYKKNNDIDYLFTTQTNDKEIMYMINNMYYKFDLIIDPHTAVAFDSLFYKYVNYERFNKKYHNIVMSTADPIKFYNEIDYTNKLVIPYDIKEILKKEEYIIKCKNNYDDVKSNILKN